MPLIAFSCLVAIAIAIMLSTILNKSGEGGHHSLVSDLSENNLSPLSVMSMVGFF
jgi:hypothetical protein